jgi:hypothetical protein
MSALERHSLSQALYAWRELVFYHCTGSGRYAAASDSHQPLTHRYSTILKRHNEVICA